jgi:hypothetical protein
MAFSLSLPLPPSTNHLFATVGRKRIRTAKYNSWARNAGTVAKIARPSPVCGKFALQIGLPFDMPGDISNRIKAVEDLLVDLKFTDDDRHCVRVVVERNAAVPKGFCVVSVEVAA